MGAENVGEGAGEDGAAGGTAMKCLEYKEMRKGSLIGFATLEMDSGLIIKDCTFCEGGGRQWVSPPGKPQIDKDGTVVRDDNGKQKYVNIIQFRTKEIQDNWSGQAVRAIAAHISGGRQ